MTEQQEYRVLKSRGVVELREYAPCVVADVVTSGSAEQAGSAAFRPLFEYISGANRGAEPLAMTAPVILEPQSSKIAMTAPVTLEPQSADANMQSAKQWLVQFVMPSQYTLATIPKPKNNAVSLREIPSKHYAVLKYSGFNTVARVQARTQEARELAIKNNLKMIGQPQLSRYDPPWTLPMFRRNEIMIEISAP